MQSKGLSRVFSSTTAQNHQFFLYRTALHTATAPSRVNKEDKRMEAGSSFRRHPITVHSVVGGNSLTRSAHVLSTKGVAWGVRPVGGRVDETNLYAAYHNRW